MFEGLFPTKISRVVFQDYFRGAVLSRNSEGQCDLAVLLGVNISKHRYHEHGHNIRKNDC
jgi:hypothetical protein